MVLRGICVQRELWHRKQCLNVNVVTIHCIVELICLMYEHSATDWKYLEKPDADQLCLKYVATN